MNAWRCNRCGDVSTAGTVDDVPDNWRHMDVPVRGSGGARSTTPGVMCAACDDAYYRWWHMPKHEGVPA